MEGQGQAWIGLYRIPWRWSDGSASHFTHFSTGEPNNKQQDEFCVAEDVDRQWHDESCSRQFPFICEKPNSKYKIKMKLRLQTGGLLLASTINEQILKQLVEMLKKKGFPHVNVKWSIQPQKDLK
ncbi:hypothetical protein WMY93_027779 [Mugilogobius chulae]|uniref:C-type lectin domain-containing protein n=1 Tax=Mugilogobius chulae TaxID=88201 RepID=A0AAW0MVM9_9GOBI